MDNFFKWLSLRGIIIVCICIFFYLPLAVVAQVDTDSESSSSKIEIVENDKAMLSELDLENRYKRLAITENTIDRQLAFFNIVIAVVGGLAVALGVTVTMIFSRWIKNTRNEVQDTVGIYVAQHLEEAGTSAATFDKLVSSLKERNASYETLKESLEGLREFEERTGAIKDDPSFSYAEAQRIEFEATNGRLTKDDRRVVLGHLRNIIDQGMSGIVDPNTLFNSAVVANRFDFDTESIQLATLCNHYKPTASHNMLLADLQNTFGRGFLLDNGKFSDVKKSPSEIRKDARDQARIEILKVPREQCEIIYSRANNIANRERENGQFSVFIDAIELSKNAMDRAEELARFDLQANSDAELSSYAFVTLADFYAMRGGANWENDFWANIEQCLSTFAAESKMSTWYDSTIRNLKQTSERLAVQDRMSEMAAKYDVDLSSHETQEDRQRRELLEVLQRQLGDSLD